MINENGLLKIFKVTQEGRKKKTEKLKSERTDRQLQKDREDEKAEGYVPDEGTRKTPQKNN